VERAGTDENGGNYREFVGTGGGFALIPFRSDSGRGCPSAFPLSVGFLRGGLARAVPVVPVVTARGCAYGRGLSRLVHFAGAADGRGWWARSVCVLLSAVGGCGASC